MANDNDEQLHQLLAMADAASADRDIAELLTDLASRTRELMGADTAAFLLLDPAGRELVATAAAGLEEEVRRRVRIPVGEGFAGRVAATAGPRVLDRVDDTTVVNPILIEEQLTVLAGVPLTAAGRVLGVLHVGSRTTRTFTQADIDRLRLVANIAALALGARLPRIEEHITVALQRSLLPARPPTVPGLDVAARYIPGGEAVVGGDWYDLLALPSLHVGLVIGDVAGSGLRAAVVMGRIRSALRAYALETDDPADVLTRLDRKVQVFEPEAMATVAYAVIDPDRSTATVSLAGHPPPLLVPTGRPARSLEAAADPPLGAFPHTLRRAVTVPLPDAMLLYTDGLVERRGASLNDGITALARGIQRHPAPASADELCDRATTTLLRHPATDDVALIALRRTTASRP